MNRFRKSCLSQYLQSRELVKANCQRRFEADQALKLSRKKKSTSRLTIRIMYLRHCESHIPFMYSVRRLCAASALDLNG